MKVCVTVSDLGFEREIVLDEHIPVHRVLYETIDCAKKQGIQRANDIYIEMASYGLYYQSSTMKEVDEIPKDQCLKENVLEEGKKLFVLHRGKKATQHRRRDEEAFRTAYETRKEPGGATGVGTGESNPNRLDQAGPNQGRISKRKRTQLIPSTPAKRRKVSKQSKKKGNIETPLSHAEEISKIKKKITASEKKRSKSIVIRRQKLGPLSPSDTHFEMTLKHIIRCHSKGESNYKNDYSTPVYCVAFLPSHASIAKNHDANNSLQTIACTGGAHKISFIECKDGKVLKMFQAGTKESFYCIATTFVPHFGHGVSNENVEDSIIVAAAGKEGNVKLIHYYRNECFHLLQGHTGAINALVFSPNTPYHLLSASSDQTVRLWDIRDGTTLAIFHTGMEITTIDISSDGSYFVVGGGSFKEKTFGFDLFALRRDVKSKNYGTSSLLRHRMPSTSSLITIDCIRLLNHTTFVCKSLPGNQIIGWSFFREPGARELRCVESFRLQNQHSISQTLHKFTVTHDKKELLVADKDGGISIFAIPNADSSDLSIPQPPKMIAYHPQCVDFGLQVNCGMPGVDGGLHYAVSTGSMNYVYIWEREAKENTYFDEMDVEILHKPISSSFASNFPSSHNTNMQQPFVVPSAPPLGYSGWGQYPVLNHGDFTQLNSSVIVIGSDDEEVEEEDDDIIVYP